MPKSSVEKERLGNYVITPIGCESSFADWWRSLSESTNVQVRYPYERHGNAGKKSNSAKSSVMADFLKFVDANSQPNGRSADSHGPTHYFISNFSTIQIPKSDVPNYGERVRRSVVGEFCKAQSEEGKSGCSNGSASNWLHTHRPKVAICPHKQDYCDTCSKLNAQVHSKRTTLNRIRQSGSASVEDQQDLEAEIKELECQHETHRKEAQLCHEDHIKLIKRCKEQMEKISTLQQNTSRSEEDYLRVVGTNNHVDPKVCKQLLSQNNLGNYFDDPNPLPCP